MKCTLLGFKEMKFPGKDGNLVHMGQIFVSHKFPLSDDPNQVKGECCSQFNVPPEFLEKFEVGGCLLLDLDKKGKILELETL